MSAIGASEVEVRPRYTCCHPNAKGTGGTVRFELHPAHGQVEGSVFATFAAQKTVGSYENGRKIMPTFDWENRITVRLDINEVAEMLEVFRGYREKLVDGNGLFHRTAKASTVITLEHRLEPAPGYLFGVSRKTVEGSVRRMGVLLSMKEALVLSESLASGLLYMAFGVPKVLARASKEESRAQPQLEPQALKDVA
jgi:hypothetical protein